MDILVKRICHLTDGDGVAIDEWDHATAWLFDELPAELPNDEQWQLSDGQEDVRCRKGWYQHLNKQDSRTEAEVLRDRVFSAVANDAIIEVESSWRPKLPCLLSSDCPPSRLDARVELTFTRLSDLPDFKESIAICSAMPPLFDDFPNVWPKLNAELVAAGNAMGPQPGLWLPFSFDSGRGSMLITEQLAERAFRADVYARGTLIEGTPIHRRADWSNPFDGSSGRAELDLGFIRAVQECSTTSALL